MRQQIGLGCGPDLAYHWGSQLETYGYPYSHRPLGERVMLQRALGWVLVFQPYERPSDYLRWIVGLRSPALLLTHHIEAGIRVADQLGGAIVAHPDHAANDLPDMLAMLPHSRGRTLILRGPGRA